MGESTTASITKTAYDALQAKLSAINAGHNISDDSNCSNCVVPENQHVYEYLLKQIVSTKKGKEGEQQWRPKQQTPVVNAGYAARIRTISYTIQHFLNYHTVRRTPQIQIVMLGCGLDVIGLWSSSLLMTMSKSSKSSILPKLKVIELDVHEICTEKRSILKRQNLVKESSIITTPLQPPPTSSTTAKDEEAVEDDNDQMVFHGTIQSGWQQQQQQQDNSIAATTEDHSNNYALLSVDLRDIASLSSVAQRYVIHKDEIPTLVISELVLAYLEEDNNVSASNSRSELSSSSVDNLLSWSSTNLCCCPGSVMMILEPLGSTNSSPYKTVLDGYKSTYSIQFESKLEKGKSKNSTPRKQPTTTTTTKISSSFSPFASSPTQASERFKTNGWNEAYSTNLGMATSQTLLLDSVNDKGKGGFRIPEIFDEHAALTLHLKSYVVSFAFSDHTDELLKRLLCRWIYVSTREVSPFLQVPSLNNLNDDDYQSDLLAYTYIEKQDEVKMRQLFYNVYCNYFEQYPAIRKMMDGVMKSDFSMEPPSNHKRLKLPVPGSSFFASSVIGERYKSLGGGFIVAVTYDQNTNERRVVGCVGIRKCEQNEYSLGSKTNQRTLEIFRMAVDAQHRKKRLRQNLLSMVEKIAIARSCSNLVANTLTILESAQRLYERNGYVFVKYTPLGRTLVMKTYVKDIRA